MSYPSLPLFVDAWKSDTAHLTLLERGIYMELLLVCWITPGCRVPNDLAWIGRHLRCTEAEMPVLQSVIAEFMRSDGSWLSQKRLLKEHDYVQERATARRQKLKAIACSSCGQSFQPARADQRYCSAACRLRAHREGCGKTKKRETALKRINTLSVSSDRHNVLNLKAVKRVPTPSIDSEVDKGSLRDPLSTVESHSAAPTARRDPTDGGQALELLGGSALVPEIATPQAATHQIHGLRDGEPQPLTAAQRTELVKSLWARSVPQERLVPPTAAQLIARLPNADEMMVAYCEHFTQSEDERASELARLDGAQAATEFILQTLRSKA